MQNPEELIKKLREEREFKVEMRKDKIVISFP